MPITSQPFAVNAPMVAVCDHSNGNEKQCSHQHHGHEYAGEGQSRRCKRARSRRILTAALLATFSVLLFLLVSCLWDAAFNEGSWLSAFGLTEDGSGSAWTGMTGFVKRQSSGTGTGSDSTFVNRKYYLIIIFVGLFLVVVAGVCLSAWCCRGAFQNPLCCPCYLCACCGGLACLECIGCGLCAAGLEEM